MELRHLRYFVAVASHGSFNRAAEILNLSQPPLSRQVRDLEEELGLTLLVRGPNSVRLTDAGEQFYEEAREVLARADEAVRRMRGEAKKEVLRVGYTSSASAGIIAAVLARFHAAAPRVRIELVDLSSRELIEMAGEGRLDFVICPKVTIPNGITGFQWTELHRSQPVLVLPMLHPLAKLKRIPVARLNELPLVGLANDNYPEYATSARELLKPFGITPSFVSLVNDNFSTLFVELEARNAAAILIEGIENVLPQKLVARGFAPKLPSVPTMVGLPALHPKPYATKFVQLLMEEARRSKNTVPSRAAPIAPNKTQKEQEFQRQ